MKVWNERSLTALAKSMYEEYANDLSDQNSILVYEDLDIETQRAWKRLFSRCYIVGFDEALDVTRTDQGKVFPFFDSDSGLMIIAAIRYCFGRRTYMPSTAIEWTKKNWAYISPGNKATIVRDVSEYISSGLSLGDDCDATDWRNFHEWLLLQSQGDNPFSVPWRC